MVKFDMKAALGRTTLKVASVLTLSLLASLLVMDVVAKR